MCGIAGIFSRQAANLPLPPQLIETVTDTIAHRGPDSAGYFKTSNIALGHRRLSIIDLSTAANQPFFDHTGRYVLVFNGEIYNYLEVKPLLADYPFQTSGDSEVLLAAYIRWGEKCLDYLNGMFAFAIWDTVDETLFIARDRLGVKPFYFYQSEQYFVFASEIRAILASGLAPKRLDAARVRDYLMFQTVYAPHTIVENIVQLMPGEYAFVGKNTMRRAYYWQVEQPQVYHEDDFSDETSIKKRVQQLMYESVERRLVSDVPLGAFLSGGIDSSAVVGLMAQASTERVNTFSISFSEKKYDESRFAEMVAKKFNTRHHDIRLTANDLLQALPQIVDTIDAPSGDGANTYMVSKAVKDAGITVALSGLGGDELFGGYPYFRYYQRLRKIPMLWQTPRPIRQMAAAMIPAASHNSKYSRIKAMMRVQTPRIEEIYQFFRQTMGSESANALLANPQMAQNSFADLLLSRSADIEDLPMASRVSVGEILGYTLNVLLRDTDQFSMASALEVREPFFDYRLVEYVMQIPDKYKMNGFPKQLLVDALHPMLPTEVYDRPKMGFSFPWHQWLQSDLKDFCYQRLQKLMQYPMFNATEIERYWQRFIHNHSDVSWVNIWQLVVLGNWLEVNEF